MAGTEYDIGDFEEKTPSEPFDLSSFEAGTPILPSAPSTPSPLTPANLDDFVVEGGKLKSDPKIEAAVEKTRKRRIGLAGRLKERFGRKQPAKRQSEKEPEKEPEGEPTYALEGNTLNVTWPNGVTKSTTIHAPDYIELMIVTTDITFQSMEKGYENQEVLKIKLKGSDNFQNIWYAPEYKGLISLSPPAGSRLSEKGLRLNKLSNGDFKVELIKKAPLVSRRTILGGAAALTVAAIAERIYKAIENTTDEDKPAKDKTQETPQPQPQSQQPSQAPQPTQPPQPQPPQQEKAQTKADLDQSPSGAKITFKTLQEGIDGGYLKLLPSGNPVTTRGFKWASNRPFSKDNPETFAVIKQ
ncbi:hypothetical protein HZC20_03600 [Candidatus Peregrinibacteria bacterium]|nr:hypothetical protein [Candidatus Peregrinibacteria bacterium]